MKKKSTVADKSQGNITSFFKSRTQNSKSPMKKEGKELEIIETKKEPMRQSQISITKESRMELSQPSPRISKTR